MKSKKEQDKYQKTLKEAFEKFGYHDHIIPIYKRCPNEGKPCFCTGECQTIIGYREKHRLER